MDITLGKERAVYLAAKTAHVAIGPANDTKVDVYFATSVTQPAGASDKSFLSAGEYEVQGVMVDGIATGEGLVSYHMIIDGVRIAAVALQRASDLNEAMLEKLQPADVALLWLGEGKSDDVVSIFSRLEANFLLPIDVPVAVEELEKDLQLTFEATSKLKVSARDIADEKRALVGLKI